MEDNNLLPQSQHGLRPHRSTMTVLAELQQRWAKNQKAKETEKAERAKLGKRPIGTHLCGCGYRGMAKNRLRHWHQCPARHEQNKAKKTCPPSKEAGENK